VAANALEVSALRRHVHVQLPAGVEKGGIQVPMLHSVASAPVKVAGSAVFPIRQADGLGRSIPVRRVIHLSSELSGFINRVAGSCGKLFIFAGLFVADKTIYVVLR
jgi:hypothetical protein